MTKQPYISPNPDHSSQTRVHRIENWVFADKDARQNVSNLEYYDLGKIAFQTDIKVYWRLDAVFPNLIWYPIGGLGAVSGDSDIVYGIFRYRDGVENAYIFSALGLANANNDASSGDTIYMVGGTIGGNHTLKSGVSYRGIGRNTILSGIIINNGIMSGLKVSGTLTNNSTLDLIVNSDGHLQMSGRLGIGITPRTDIQIDTTSAANLLRLSSPASHYCTLQLYSRTGENYAGWALFKDQNSNDFKLNYDDSENNPQVTYMKIDISHGDIHLTPASGDLILKEGNLEMDQAAGTIIFLGTSGGGGEGLEYKDSGGAVHSCFIVPGSDIVAVVNRASNGVVQIRANTSTAGDGGEITVIEVQDDKVIFNEVLSLVGDARVTESMWISAGTARAPGAKPAAFVQYGLTGVWQFGDEIEANQESISGTVRLPSTMDKTIAPLFIIGWSADGVSPGNCEWQLEYLFIAPNEATDGAAQETLTVTSTASSTSNGLVFATFTGVDVPGSTDVAFFFRITRLSGHANDTISDDVELRGMNFKYTINKLGTPT